MSRYELIKKENGKIEVWTKGLKSNKILYYTNMDLDTVEYRKNDLTYVSDFLLKNNEILESNKIMNHFGKIIRHKNIPKLIPTGDYKINVRLSHLKHTINDFIEEDELDLNPDFQRCHVWTRQQQVKFVEFILQGGRCPAIYFNENDEYKNMVIVDGKQRLTALLSFLNNEFTVFKNLDKDNIGYYSNEFEVLGTNIEIMINNLPTKEKVLEWYLQINKGQVAHTKEEIEKVEIMLKNELNKKDR